MPRSPPARDRSRRRVAPGRSGTPHPRRPAGPSGDGSPRGSWWSRTAGGSTTVAAPGWAPLSWRPIRHGHRSGPGAWRWCPSPPGISAPGRRLGGSRRRSTNSGGWWRRCVRTRQRTPVCGPGPSPSRPERAHGPVRVHQAAAAGARPAGGPSRRRSDCGRRRDVGPRGTRRRPRPGSTRHSPVSPAALTPVLGRRSTRCPS